MRQTILLALGLLLAAKASAQYATTINGTSFSVDVDDKTMTASIVDYTYKIDDRRYAVAPKPRKMAGFTHEQQRTVEVPSTFTRGSKEYTITSIGRAVFAGFKNIDHVVVPSTVTAIGDYAFYGSSVLSVKLPQTVATIGTRAFGRCDKLQQLTLPEDMDGPKEKALYAESKHVRITYYEPVDEADEDFVYDTPAPATQVKPAADKPKKMVVARTSDVDTDLPQAKRENENTFAIIIANENYRQEPRVLCALHDGEVFRDYCQTVLGLPKENINFVQDATKNEMVAAVDWATDIAKVYQQDARVIVYYSGHGIPDDASRAAYLLPVDAMGNNPKMAYGLAELYASLGQLEAKDVTVFLDACFSGADRGEGTIGGHSKSVAIKANPASAQGNMVVFSAAQGDETAWPYAEKAHGLFTYFLLKKLKESKGAVTYGELGDYLQKQVARRSIVVNKKSQTPTVVPSRSMSDSWQKLTLR